jgi:hypothetical protein
MKINIWLQCLAMNDYSAYNNSKVEAIQMLIKLMKG